MKSRRLPKIKTAVLVVVVVLAAAACASVATQRSAAGQHEAGAGAQSAAQPTQAAPAVAKPPPFVGPPALADRVWTMPDVQQTHPTFPYLPGDARDVSRSVGGTTHGWLAGAARIPEPSAHLQILAVQHERGLNYTSDRMVELIEAGAAHVAQAYPGAVLHVGNFSAQGGGDIPYSVSHNSGRDGDVGFYLVGPDDQPVAEPDLLPLDANGRYEGPEGIYRFAPGRNWAFIEAIIQSDAARLQYIFVSRPLKRMLLAEGRRQNAPAKVLERARVLLHQPGGSLAHNDHFHLRIYCSERDVRSGCRDRGRRVAGYRGFGHARRQTIERAVDALDDPASEVRLAAVRRLALMDARGRAKRVRRRLDDADPRVRAAAARTLGRWQRQPGAIAEHLTAEKHPQVVVEMINALGRIGGPRALEALRGQLSHPRPVELAGQLDTDARAFVAEALIKTESPNAVPELIALLDSDRPDVRLSAARALRILTNHRFADAAAIVSEMSAARVARLWNDWYDDHADQNRQAWLAAGFEDAGYDVGQLSVDHVWDLCRAVADADYLSYNAQRVLMGLSGRHPASLSWSKEDANFYWRRWFERRWRRFGAPAIPPELSTLDGTD